MKDWRFPEPVPPIEETVVWEIIQWQMGDRKEMSMQAKSDLGFDEFNYQYLGRFPPSKEQFTTLRERLFELALESPEVLLFHIFHESLPDVVGNGFTWVVFGRVKTAFGAARWRLR